MSTWKVSKQRVKLFDHGNADKLQIARIGTYQCVVQKGLYKDDDEVVFAPEKSILTGKIKEEYSAYLAGPNKDRVKSVRLRGEYSCGIIIPPMLLEDVNLSNIHIDEDISELLGISKYVPPVPIELAGLSAPINAEKYGKHDCEHFSGYANEFVDEERVIISEKLHGSQGIYYYNLTTGEKFVSSKGQLDRGLQILESETNSYWLAAKNTNLWHLLELAFNDVKNEDGSDVIVQVFGEVVPVQGGYTYGFDKPVVRLFDVRLNGKSIPCDKNSREIKEIWVPVLFDGPLKKSTVAEYSLGMETVSGKRLHIKEGCVVRPYIDRYASDGTKLRLKIINPEYSKKETGEEIN